MSAALADGFFLFIYLLIFNWRIIALQYCVGFCHTSTWITIGIHMSPPSRTSLPAPTPSHPSSLSQSPGLSSLSHTANSHWLSILHMMVYMFRDSLVVQMIKRLPAMRETRVWSPSQEDPLDKEMATHFSTLAWKIPWMEEPGGLQPMGSQRVRHDWVTFHFSLSQCTCFHATRPIRPTISFPPYVRNSVLYMAGRFLSTGPPGKSSAFSLKIRSSVVLSLHSHVVTAG